MATIKQKTALNKVVENGGNVSKAMRDAGYTEKTAKTPQKLTESKGWKELVEEYLPDDLLARVHHEGLQATKGKKPDYFARHKYLDTAYKIKGEYAPEKFEGNITIDKMRYERAKQIVAGRTGRNRGA